jgi:hypothetical protein
MDARFDLVTALLAATVCVCASQTAVAAENFYSGNFYLRHCKNLLSGSSEDRFNQGNCLGVVRTLMDLGEHLPGSGRFCVPRESSREQGIRVLVAFLEAQPHRLHEDFIDLAMEAYRKAWPCKVFR